MFANVPKKYIFKNGKVEIQPESYLKLLFALGILNSLTLDFIARGMVQLHLNKTVLLRLPLPQPTETEILKNADYCFIARRALELQRAADSQNNFAELEALFPDFQSLKGCIEKKIDHARAALDVKVARLYGLTFEDFQHLISPENFKVLNEKREEYLRILRGRDFWEKY